MTAKIGERVSKAREALDWTQVELARRSGVSPSYLSRLEDGVYRQPSHAKLRALANALGVQVADLTDDPVDTASRDALRQLIERRVGPDDAPLLSEMVDVLADWSPDERSFAVEMAHSMIVNLRRSSMPRPHTGNRTPTS